MLIRNWKDATPYVGHESAIIWTILREKGTGGSDEQESEEACMQGLVSLTNHLMQGGKSGDYHSHEDIEQVYYITKGRGKMKIDGEIYEVKEGDAVHLPPNCKHQLINDSEDWIEHLIISTRVPT